MGGVFVYVFGFFLSFEGERPLSVPWFTCVVLNIAEVGVLC